MGKCQRTPLVPASVPGRAGGSAEREAVGHRRHEAYSPRSSRMTPWTLGPAQRRSRPEGACSRQQRWHRVLGPAVKTPPCRVRAGSGSTLCEDNCRLRFRSRRIVNSARNNGSKRLKNPSKLERCSFRPTKKYSRTAPRPPLGEKANTPSRAPGTSGLRYVRSCPAQATLV